VLLIDNYSRAQSHCTQIICENEMSREERITDSNNVGKFDKFVNKKMSCSSGVGCLRSKDVIVTDDKSKADILNDFFANVCTVDNNMPLCLSRLVPDNVCLSSVSFTPMSVVKAISKIKSNSSSGPDGLPPCVLNNLSNCLALPLSLIFTSFMSVGQVPAE
jgi:hypothetical protein